jgi:hypothetical protein
MDISLRKPEETRYYSVPPCPLSPNYNPNIPVPPIKVKQEVRPSTPPLNTAQAKTQAKAKAVPQPQSGYRTSNSSSSGTMAGEETILQEARKILLARGQDISVLGQSPAPTTSVQTPQVPVARAPKRTGNPLMQTAQGPNSMDTEDAVSEGFEGFTVIEPEHVAQMEDQEILEQLRQLEESTSLLLLTLQNRALSSMQQNRQYFQCSLQKPGSYKNKHS